MSDLRGFTAPEPVDVGSTGKIFAALAVALVVCATGTYTYETGMWNSRPVQFASNDVPPPVMARAPAGPAVLAPTQPAVAPPVQTVQTPAQVAATPRVEIARPHVLAQRSQRGVTIAPPAEPTIDQSAPAEIAPQAPADSVTSPQSESQSTAQPQQDAPAQTPQPDGSATPQ